MTAPMLHYDMLKPREIRERLRGKIDPAIGKILVQLCEDNRQTRMQLAELTKVLDGYADVINAMTHIVDAMKSQYERKFGPMPPPGTAETPSDKVRAIAPKDGGNA